MIPVRQMGIAVIGDEDLVNGMRLAGIDRYHLIPGGPEAGPEVGRAMAELIAEPDIGVIVMLEDYAKYVTDLLAQIRKGRRLTPVVVEVPSKGGTAYGDAREYYKAYIRSFIGFDVEI